MEKKEKLYEILERERNKPREIYWKYPFEKKWRKMPISFNEEQANFVSADILSRGLHLKIKVKGRKPIVMIN